MIALVGGLAQGWVGTTDMGTLSVTMDAAPYRGRRVRVEGAFRGELDADWSGLWVRVDGAAPSVASFDTTMERSSADPSAWIVHSVELDVGADARSVAFGVLLSGNTTVRVDDLVLVDAGRARGREPSAGHAKAARARRARRHH
ncbi:MAG: hypothetical protein R3F61_06150 [Myxococcota bacterium]